MRDTNVLDPTENVLDPTEHRAAAPTAPARPGTTRRQVLTRAAVAGGLVWTAPIVRSLPAGAATVGSAPCPCHFCATTPYGDLLCQPVDPDATTCNCICNCAAGRTVAPCDQANPCAVELVCAPVTGDVCEVGGAGFARSVGGAADTPARAELKQELARALEAGFTAAGWWAQVPKDEGPKTVTAEVTGALDVLITFSKG